MPVVSMVCQTSLLAPGMFIRSRTEHVGSDLSEFCDNARDFRLDDLFTALLTHSFRSDPSLGLGEGFSAYQFRSEFCNNARDFRLDDLFTALLLYLDLTSY